MQQVQEIRLRTAALIDLTRTHAALREAVQGALDVGISRDQIAEHLRGAAAELTDQAAAELVWPLAPWFEPPLESAELHDAAVELAAST